MRLRAELFFANFPGRRQLSYSIQLRLKANEKLNLMERESLDEGPIFEAVEAINDYLGLSQKEGDFGLTLLSDD
jgi:hypothetical protein